MFILFQMIGCNTIYRYVRDKKEKNYKEGIELYKQKKIEEAKDRFETVVDIEPEYRDAKRYLDYTIKIIALKKRNIKQRANINYDKKTIRLH